MSATVRVEVGGDYFDVDLGRLEEEWANHPRVYHEHALALEDARRDHEQAKAAKKLADEDLRHTAAKLDLEVRRAPAEFGFPAKPTEKAIENAVVCHKHYRRAVIRTHEAQQKVIQTGHAAGVLEVACKTLDNKKFALQDLVRLWERDYFSKPRARGGDFGRRAGEAAADLAFGKKKKGGRV